MPDMGSLKRLLFDFIHFLKYCQTGSSKQLFTLLKLNLYFMEVYKGKQLPAFRVLISFNGFNVFHIYF